MGRVTPYPRCVRIASLLQVELSEWLQREVDEPWDRSATITRVEVTEDLGHATVWLLLHEEDETEPARADALVAYLEGAAGRLRGWLGRRLRLKRIPRLRFRYDRPYAQAAEVVGTISRWRLDRAETEGSHEDGDGGPTE